MSGSGAHHQRRTYQRGSSRSGCTSSTLSVSISKGAEQGSGTTIHLPCVWRYPAVMRLHPAFASPFAPLPPQRVSAVGQSHIIACRDVHVVHLDNHRTWTRHGTTRVPMRAVRIEALQWQLGHGIEREDIGGHRVTRCPRCPWRAPRAASCPPGRGSRLRLWLGPCSYAFFSRKRVDAGCAVLHTEEPALTVPQLPSTTRRSDRRPYQSAEQRRSWSTASAPAHPRPAQRTAARPWLRPAP
jgi:hypothetical protein